MRSCSCTIVPTACAESIARSAISSTPLGLGRLFAYNNRKDKKKEIEMPKNKEIKDAGVVGIITFVPESGHVRVDLSKEDACRLRLNGVQCGSRVVITPEGAR